jgi:hypothetical protein
VEIPKAALQWNPQGGRKRGKQKNNSIDSVINFLTPELNPSAQRCPTIFFTGDFAS